MGDAFTKRQIGSGTNLKAVSNAKKALNKLDTFSVIILYHNMKDLDTGFTGAFSDNNELGILESKGLIVWDEGWKLYKKEELLTLTRLLSSLFSALLLSLVFTMVSQNNNTDDNVLYYSFMTEFLNGFLILISIYLFFATPVSLYIDRTIRSRSILLHLFLYFLIGGLMGSIILLINSANDVQAALQLILLFGSGASVFSLFLHLFAAIINKRK